MSETKLTKEYLDGLIKEIVGPMIAEIRTDNEKKSAHMGEIMAGAVARGMRQSQVPAEETKGLRMARFFRAMAAGRMDPTRARAFAEGAWKDDIGGEIVESLKALSSGVGTAGGFIVPPAYSAELIELLRNQTAVRRLGADSVPMPTGSITIPKQTGTASFEYVGENMGNKASQPKVGNISLTFKKLRGTVPVSNDLLQFANPSADTMVRNDLLNGFRVKEDAVFLRSAGTSFSPKGLLSWCLAANKIAANGTVNLANVTTDLGKVILALEEANVPFIRFGWVFAPRTRHYLMTVRDGNGNFAFRPEMLQGTLWGYPFVSTNQVPKNLGGASDESEVYGVDYADVVIGEVNDITIDASTEAAYLDENGNLISAFANDQTVLRAIAKHDLGVRREESIAMLTGVKWA